MVGKIYSDMQYDGFECVGEDQIQGVCLEKASLEPVAAVVNHHGTRNRSESPQERSVKRFDMERRAISADTMAVQPDDRAVPDWWSGKLASRAVVAGVWIGLRLSLATGVRSHW